MSSKIQPSAGPPLSTPPLIPTTIIPQSFLNLATNQYEPTLSILGLANTLYDLQGETPTFVRIVRPRKDGKIPFNGKRPVDIVVSNIQELFEVSADRIESELTLYQYDLELCFWELKEDHSILLWEPILVAFTHGLVQKTVTPVVRLQKCQKE